MYISYEDVELAKLLYEDLLRKHRVSVLNLYIESHKLTTASKKKINEKKKPKLDLVSIHIQLSAAIGSVSTGKDTSGSESRVSSSEASEDCDLQEVGSDTSSDDNTPLAKLVSNSWSDSDSDVPLSVLRQNSFLTKRGRRPEVYDFVVQKMWFPWITLQPKDPCLIEGGSCNFQPSFMGWVSQFCAKRRGGPCVFYPPHFQMPKPTHPILF